MGFPFFVYGICNSKVSVCDCVFQKKELIGLESHLVSQIINQLSNLNVTNDPDVAKCYKYLFSLMMKVKADVILEGNLHGIIYCSIFRNISEFSKNYFSKKRERISFFPYFLENFKCKILSYCFCLPPQIEFCSFKYFYAVLTFKHMKNLKN